MGGKIKERTPTYGRASETAKKELCKYLMVAKICTKEATKLDMMK